VNAKKIMMTPTHHAEETEIFNIDRKNQTKKILYVKMEA
jgi:hypothetical protein